MNARAVWTGLAALLTATLGWALSLSSSTLPSWGRFPPCVRWLLVCVYAVAVVAVHLVFREKSGSPSAGRWRWLVLVTVGSGVTALMALGLLWFFAGVWPAFVIGGPVVLALTVRATILRPGPFPAVGLGVEMLLLALVLPVVGFAAGGAPLALYPWITSAVLVVPSLAFLLAIHPEMLAEPDPGHHDRRDRLMTLGLALLGLGGVLLVGRFFPGSSEIRLLGISPATVVASTTLAAFLHPSAEGGRRLAEILVPVSYLSMTAGLSLLYAIA